MSTAVNAVAPVCPSCNTGTLSIRPHDSYVRLVCSSCDRWLGMSEIDTPTMAKALKMATEAWRYPEGKCPRCPAEPMKERRARCPICREWIRYTPDHPGHQKFSGFTGRWSKVIWKPAGLAFLGHMNTAPNHKGEAFVNAFYEKPA